MEVQAKTCPTCSTTNPVNAKVCMECGEKFPTPAPEATTKVCPTCQTENPIGAKVCMECGEKFPTPVTQTQVIPTPLPPPAQPVREETINRSTRPVVRVERVQALPPTEVVREEAAAATQAVEEKQEEGFLDGFMFGIFSKRRKGAKGNDHGHGGHN